MPCSSLGSKAINKKPSVTNVTVMFYDLDLLYMFCVRPKDTLPICGFDVLSVGFDIS